MSNSKHKSLFKSSQALVEKSDSNITLKEKPLIVLLGWVGSTNKQLDKYAALWNSKGFNTLQYETPFQDFAFPYFMRFKAIRLLREVKNTIEKTPSKSVIFHIFSNGGGFNYAHFLQLMKTKEFASVHRCIRGVIYDSLPTLSGMTGLRALKMSTPRIVFYIILLLTPILFLQWIPFAWNYYSTMYAKNNRFLHLFLYSKRDALVHYKGVEEFKSLVSASLRDDRLILSNCFDDSEHVQHLRKYPKEYNHHIDIFINKVGASENNDNDERKTSKL